AKALRLTSRRPSLHDIPSSKRAGSTGMSSVRRVRARWNCASPTRDTIGGGAQPSARLVRGRLPVVESPQPARRLRVVYLDHTARMSGAEIGLLRFIQAADAVEPIVLLAEDGPLIPAPRE